MYSTFALALLAAVATANNGQGHGRDPDFMNWVAKNNKSFASIDEMDKREKNFKASVYKVRDLRHEHPKARFALNFFADLDDDEKKEYIGLDESKLKDRRLAAEEDAGRQLRVVPSVDWRTTGNIGPVKNQGQCGSCWSFNATTVLEAVKSIKDSAGGAFVAPVRLSEQEGVDCSSSYGNNGCNGGWPSNYWNYARASGAVKYSDYPYTARDDPCTRTSGMAVQTRVTSWSWVSAND